MLPNVIEDDVDLAANLPVGIVGDAYATRFGDSLKTRRDVDPIAENIVIVNDDVADVNAELRAMTKNERMHESAAVIASTIPSAR